MQWLDAQAGVGFAGMGMEVFGPGLLESPWEGIQAAADSNCVMGLATKGHKIWAGT